MIPEGPPPPLFSILTGTKNPVHKEHRNEESVVPSLPKEEELCDHRFQGAMPALLLDAGARSVLETSDCRTVAALLLDAGARTVLPPTRKTGSFPTRFHRELRLRTTNRDSNPTFTYTGNALSCAKRPTMRNFQPSPRRRGQPRHLTPYGHRETPSLPTRP